jgi:hypothetical protein
MDENAKIHLLRDKWRNARKISKQVRRPLGMSSAFMLHSYRNHETAPKLRRLPIGTLENVDDETVESVRDDPFQTMQAGSAKSGPSQGLPL